MVRVAQSLVSSVVFCRSLFVFCLSLFWPLHCLSFFGLRLLINPLVFSNFIYIYMSGLNDKAMAYDCAFCKVP